MVSPLLMGAVVDGVLTTSQTPLSGHFSPVLAVVPSATEDTSGYLPLHQAHDAEEDRVLPGRGRHLLPLPPHAMRADPGSTPRPLVIGPSETGVCAALAPDLREPGSSLTQGVPTGGQVVTPM